jgi:periplasmic divalent cation tolerance protein
MSDVAAPVSATQSPPGVSVVLVTMPSMERAATLARTLVQEQLIACANLIPQVRSIYEWKGEVCDEAEVLLVLKSRPEAFERLRARVKALHPYEVPEVIELPVTAGDPPYLDWVHRQVCAR